MAFDPVETMLQALHADPTDETAWLALADCLEEQDQNDRAELTRLGLRLRQWPDVEDRDAVERRVQQLLQAGVRPCVPTLVNSLGIPFVLVPPGTFLMGSPPEEYLRGTDEGPVHEVVLTRPFYLAAHPVTQAQYEAITGRNPSYFHHAAPHGGNTRVHGLDTRNFPVDGVSWEAAVGFCEALGQRRGETKAGRVYQLPTEAQWEYACRAGTRTPFHFGDSATSYLANFDGNYPYGEGEKGPYLLRTADVGQYVPNVFGLYDMHGNVWEWCRDWFSESFYADGQRDPCNEKPSANRVVRGGAYGNFSRSCRSAYRGGGSPAYRDCSGIRLLIDWPIA